MCGIIGFVGNNFPTHLPLNLLKHRGPDANGSWTNNHNCILGHTRLAIIDLNERANQPMKSKGDRYIIIFNGEIYNYKELRHQYLSSEQLNSTSDTEIILKLWEKFGVQCVPLLNGMFAFSVWDNKNEELFIVRDRLGKKPLFYYSANNIIAFSSELNALKRILPISVEVNPNAIDLFLGHQFIPAPFSIFRNIQKLEKAHILTFKKGQINISRYWCLKNETIEIKDRKLTLENLENKITSSIKKRLNADVPIGCLLSGGVDSGLITAIASSKLGVKLNTFTIGFKSKNYDESPLAALVAKKYNTNHHEFEFEENVLEVFKKIISLYGEPFADNSALPSYVVCKNASKYVKVILNGDGGDELLAGYSRYNYSGIFEKFPHYAKSYNRNLLLFEKYALKCLPNDFLKKGLDKLARKTSPYYKMIRFSFLHNKNQFDYYTPEFLKETLSNRVNYELKLNKDINKNMSILNQNIEIDRSHYLFNCLLPKMDIASMANSIEARSPFLDYELIEYCNRLPDNLKIHNNQLKYLLKKLGEKYLPNEILYKKKQGFAIPLVEWMPAIFIEILGSMLINSNHVIWDYIQIKKIQNLFDLNNYTNPNTCNLLWVVIILGMWLESNN